MVTLRVSAISCQPLSSLYLLIVVVVLVLGCHQADQQTQQAHADQLAAPQSHPDRENIGLKVWTSSPELCRGRVQCDIELCKLISDTLS